MRSLVLAAALVACTLHVEMEVRSVETPHATAAPPWKSPQVSATTGSANACNALTSVSGIACNATEMATLDVEACAWKCEPMSPEMKAFGEALRNAHDDMPTVMW